MRQQPLNGCAAGQQPYAGGCHVEPVHHQCVGKEGLHAGGHAVVLVRAAAGHAEHTGGFVNHHQVLICVNDPHGGGDV